MIYQRSDAGIICEFTNERAVPRDTNYASITAPEVVRCEIFIDNVLAEVVYAGNGGSHSWWTPAGGKFFPPHIVPSGLKPGSTLKVHVSGEAALRIDWDE